MVNGSPHVSPPNTFVPSRKVETGSSEPFSAAHRPSGSHVCDKCNAGGFKSAKALQQHARIKRGVVSEIPRLVGDVSVCPVCKTDFRTRTRLMAHLSETRVRSVTRGVSCNALFLASKTAAVDGIALVKLHKVHCNAIKAASIDGHTHQIASLPAKRSLPSVMADIAITGKRSTRVRKRVSVKTAGSSLQHMYPLRSARSIQTNHVSISSHNLFFSSSILCDSSCSISDVNQDVSLAIPPKRRRVACKSQPSMLQSVLNVQAL